MKIRIEKLNDQGLGVGLINGKKVLVPYVLPKETVVIKKFQKKKGKIFALDFRLLTKSKIRVEPKCPYFGKCGGCLLQHLKYKDQIKFKKQKLRNIFQKKIKIIPSPKTFGYRGRIDVVVSLQGIGFRKRGYWDKVINIEECPLFGSMSQKAISELKKLIERENVSLYDLKTHKGMLRYLVLRETKTTNQLMVNLIFKREPDIKKLKNYFKFAHSYYISFNPGISDVSFGEPIEYFGDEFIREEILKTKYFIHPNSFFQSNPFQLKNLLKLVSKFVKGKKVLDLYCGVGTFAIFLAKKGYLVEAVEIVPESIKMAKLNAMVNDVYVNFHQKDAKDLENLDYDTVIVDPPRPGLSYQLIEKLNQSRCQRLIYVSCNPYSLAENISQLTGFKLKNIIGIDMFPQTPEIETIAVLDHK